MKIREIMSREVTFVNPNNSVQEAAVRMKELHVCDLPVIVKTEAVGFITEHDININVVAQGLDPKITKVADVMTQGIFACKEDDEITDAARQMVELKIRRIAVMDKEGKLSGIVSMDDLIRHTDPDTAYEILKGYEPH
jgi:CBS domain-containing protein